MKQKKSVLALGFVAAAFLVVGAPGVAAVGDAELSAANSALKAVEDLWEAAKKSGDMIKFNCINDKLSTMKGTVLVLSGAVESLKNATDEKDKAHEIQKIGIANGTIKQTLAAAVSCKGEVARYTGTTEKTSEVDPNQSGAGFTDVTTGSNLTSVPTTTDTRPNATSPLL